MKDNECEFKHRQRVELARIELLPVLLVECNPRVYLAGESRKEQSFGIGRITQQGEIPFSAGGSFGRRSNEVRQKYPTYRSIENPPWQLTKCLEK
ncbi:hypothetical protein RP20_CCG026041 [Aedes albopictus]|nr:hypothetical protein RP20_CCG026041 [Aedes albopictus]